MSRSSKTRPESVMLLLHKSKPKPIDWLRRLQIRDVGGGYSLIDVREIFALVDRVHAELEVGGGKRSEEKGENSPNWHRSVGWSCVGVWVDVRPSTECGVELHLSVVSAWGWN